MISAKAALAMLALAAVLMASAAARAQTAAGSARQTADAADAVGSVASLQGSASVTRRKAASALQVRDDIFAGDVLQTGADGTLGITFDDDTTFTLTPNSQISVDDFVYQQGGSSNAAVFNVLRGTVAFVAAEVAHTGDMKIETPTSSLGIRGTTGLIEVPGNAGEVSIKLYQDADGRVGRIEVFGRDGTQLGVLTRAATGFAVRPGAVGGRFTAVPLRISAAEAARDRVFVRQAFSAQLVGRQINIQRRNLRQRQPNLRPPGRPEQRGRFPGLQQRPGFRTPPGLPRPLGGQRRPPARDDNRRRH